MNDILPVGSIIKLEKDAPAAIMITGYFPIENKSGKHFDYSGAIYPEGLNSSLNLLLFNKEDIEVVLYTGYSDETHQIMIEKFSDKVDELNA